MKKILGNKTAIQQRYKTGTENQQEPEYSTMSRRPGIGKNWYQQYGSEVYEADSVIVRGKEMKPPRYYDELFELEEPEMMERIKQARRMSRDRGSENDDRRESARRVAEAKLKLSRRELG